MADGVAQSAPAVGSTRALHAKALVVAAGDVGGAVTVHLTAGPAQRLDASVERPWALVVVLTPGAGGSLRVAELTSWAVVVDAAADATGSVVADLEAIARRPVVAVLVVEALDAEAPWGAHPVGAAVVCRSAAGHAHGRLADGARAAVVVVGALHAPSGPGVARWARRLAVVVVATEGRAYAALGRTPMAAGAVVVGEALDAARALRQATRGVLGAIVVGVATRGAYPLDA